MKTFKVRSLDGHWTVHADTMHQVGTCISFLVGGKSVGAVLLRDGEAVIEDTALSSVNAAVGKAACPDCGYKAGERGDNVVNMRA